MHPPLISKFMVEVIKNNVYLNGKTCRRKADFKDAILVVLQSNGYTFDPVFRPFPSILINYHDVSYTLLKTMCINLYNQFLNFDETQRHLLDFMVVTDSGLCYRHTSGKRDRLVNLFYTDSFGRKNHKYVLCSNLPNIISKLFELQCKEILLS